MARNRPKQGNKNLIIISAVLLAVVLAVIAYGYSASQKNKALAAQTAAYNAQKEAKAKAEAESKAKRDAELKARLEKQQQQWGKPSPEQIALDQTKEQARIKAFRKATRDIELGMTRNDVRNLQDWGVPEDVNKTVTANGTHEQWVFSGSRFLYFDNDRLTAIQD